MTVIGCTEQPYTRQELSDDFKNQVGKNVIVEGLPSKIYETYGFLESNENFLIYSSNDINSSKLFVSRWSRPGAFGSNSNFELFKSKLLSEINDGDLDKIKVMGAIVKNGEEIELRAQYVEIDNVTYPVYK